MRQRGGHFEKIVGIKNNLFRVFNQYYLTGDNYKLLDKCSTFPNYYLVLLNGNEKEVKKLVLGESAILGTYISPSLTVNPNMPEFLLVNVGVQHVIYINIAVGFLIVEVPHLQIIETVELSNDATKKGEGEKVKTYDDLLNYYRTLSTDSITHFRCPPGDRHHALFNSKANCSLNEVKGTFYTNKLGDLSYTDNWIRMYKPDYPTPWYMNITDENNIVWLLPDSMSTPELIAKAKEELDKMRGGTRKQRKRAHKTRRKSHR